MSSSLSAHSPKFNSQLVSRDFLSTLPAPEALGRFHKPVPHAVLVDALRSQAERSGYEVVSEQYALGKANAALFGVIDLKPSDTSLVCADRAMSLGFRNATDQSMAIKAVAGNRVFVCDNLMLSGDIFAIHRRNSLYLDLLEAVARGFKKFTESIARFTLQIAQMEAFALNEVQAKSVIYDVFTNGLLPVRLLDEANRNYFETADDMTDCKPRSLYGVHNALTRAARELNPRTEFTGSIALGAFFAKLVQ